MEHSVWAAVAASLEAQPVAPHDVWEPLRYSATDGAVEFLFEFTPAGCQVRLTRAAVLEDGARFRFLAAAAVGPLPRLRTGDADFDAAVAIVGDDDALARLGAQTRAQLAELVAMGAWGTCTDVVWPTAATAGITAEGAANAALVLARSALDALAGFTAAALPPVAFADPAKPVRTVARGLLWKSRTMVRSHDLLAALVAHPQSDAERWLEHVTPAEAGDLGLWVQALGDSWNPRIEKQALRLIARPGLPDSPALDALLARLVEAALKSDESFSWSQRVVDSPRLLRAVLLDPRPAAIRLVANIRPNQVPAPLAEHTIDRLAAARTHAADDALARWLSHPGSTVSTYAQGRLAEAFLDRMRRGALEEAGRLGPAILRTAGLVDALLVRCAAADGDALRWGLDAMMNGAEVAPATLDHLATIEPARRALNAHYINRLVDARGDAEVQAIKALARVGGADALPELEKRNGFFADFVTKSLANEAIAAITARLDTSAAGGLALSDDAAGGLSET